jgi:hypothetical protein
MEKLDYKFNGTTKWKVNPDRVRVNSSHGVKFVQEFKDSAPCTVEQLMANALMISQAPETAYKLHETNEKLKSLLENDLIRGVGVIQTIKEMVRRNDAQLLKCLGK